MVDCLHMIRPMRVPCQDPSSLALLKSRMVLPVRLPRFSAKEAIQWVFVYAYIIYIFQQTTMASIDLLVLAQAYTVGCGDHVPANLQQQHRALQREGRIAADSAMRMNYSG